MKYKIIVDSSSNLKKDYKLNGDIGFDVAPLIVKVGDKDFIDDGTVNTKEMLDLIHSTKEKATSSCPSPYDYSSRMTDATYYIIITISSKLSGSYNSACIAKTTYSHPENVLVLDSKLVCGAMELDVRKAVELINSGADFNIVCSGLETFRDSTNLLFMIDRYDNLVKAGRVNKVLAFLASHLHIKPLCYGEDGEIKVKEKVRTIEGTLKRLVVNIGKMCSDTTNRICIISHTFNQKGADFLKDSISKEYHFKEVIIRSTEALASYYTLDGGIHVAF